MNLLALETVTTRYTATDSPAVDKVSFDCEKGEIAALIGGSGSGKTTLLRIIAGLAIPDTGKVILEGNTLNSPTKFIPPEKRNCSLVFQDYALFPNKPVLQNITFGKGATDNPDRLNELMEMADIVGLGQRHPHEISGGQQQRVAIARAVLTKPKILLADEPTGNLDPENTKQVIKAFDILIDRCRTTILVATHSKDVARKLKSKLIIESSKTVSTKI